jgi:TfoX/Sxy family transcriptional regulator of competence genes
MAYNEHLASRIRNILGSDTGIEERKMFGGLSFLVGGNMLVGLTRNDLMVRVGPDQHEEALSRQDARPMDFTGRPMKGMVFVDERHLEEDSVLAEWIEMAGRFVFSLPPKKK